MIPIFFEINYNLILFNAKLLHEKHCTIIHVKTLSKIAQVRCIKEIKINQKLIARKAWIDQVF